MSASRAAVDANVLVYSVYPSAPQHAPARRLIDSAAKPTADLGVLPQTLAEFFAVVTNPKRVAPALSASEAVRDVEAFLALPGLALLPLPTDVVAGWLNLVRARPVTGGDVFDYQLAAALLSCGVGTLYTYDLSDFAGIPGLTAVEPPP